MSKERGNPERRARVLVLGASGLNGGALARIIRSHPLTLRRHESHSTSSCADMASCGHFAVAVGEVWVSVGG